ncbi:MAG TPA: rhodanese-like domain-containing protein, partial [Chromatiaceae bacterium]|nr:rhodanese-like domain-containing protein [Chromatiaceae bacterium]
MRDRALPLVSEIDSVGLMDRIAAGEDIYLVDIRTPAEIVQAAIPNAVYIPMHLLPLRMNELPRDKDVVLYCRSGARSTMPANIWPNRVSTRPSTCGAVSSHG